MHGENIMQKTNRLSLVDLPETTPISSSRIRANFAATIGETPLVRLETFSRQYGVDLCVKLEAFNPMGTVKDRPALAMILEAERQGQLRRGMTLIEASAGSTGFSLASLARARGYRMIVTAPDSVTADRRAYFMMLGAELVLTPAAERIAGSYAKALELVETIPDSLMLDQYTSDQNWLSHYHGTGPEIWRDTAGAVDMVVAGIGTGGTFTGIGRYLKQQNNKIAMIAVEPEESSVLSGKKSQAHGIFGLGPGFRTPILDSKLVDECVTISTDDAYATARLVMDEEGIPVGPSSGATICAALRLAQQRHNKGKLIVVMATDSAERYVSTALAHNVLARLDDLKPQNTLDRYRERTNAIFAGSSG